MKENIINFFNNNILKSKVMVKMWDKKQQKWYFEIIDVKKEESRAIISYEELVKSKQVK